jgi:O-antigen ligase
MPDIYRKLSVIKWYQHLKWAKLFKNFIYFVSLAFTIVNLGGSYLGIPGIVFKLLFSGSVMYLSFVTKNLILPKNLKLLLVLCSPIILINCVVSLEIINTTIYWVFFLLTLTSFTRIINEIDRESYNYLFKHLTYSLLITSLVLFLILLPHLSENLPTKNSLGMFAGASVISAFSLKSNFKKIPIVLIGGAIVLASDSRSALAYTILVVGLYFLKSIKFKNGVWIIVISLTLFIFKGKITSVVEKKMTQKEYLSNNANEAIQMAYIERQILLYQGWDLFMKRPFFGHGLKAEYRHLLKGLGSSHSVHVHNGYLANLIETGLLLSIIVLLVILSIVRKAIYFFFSRSYNLSVWVFLLLFGFMRGYGESYLFFNIGNTFSFIFLFLSITFIMKPKLILELK